VSAKVADLSLLEGNEAQLFSKINSQMKRGAKRLEADKEMCVGSLLKI